MAFIVHSAFNQCTIFFESCTKVRFQCLLLLPFRQANMLQNKQRKCLVQMLFIAKSPRHLNHSTCHHFHLNGNVSLCQAASTSRTSSTKEKIKHRMFVFYAHIGLLILFLINGTSSLGRMSSFMLFQVRLDAY